MKRVTLAFVLMSLLLVVICPSVFAAKGNDVQFHGTVKRMELTTASQGTLTLHVMGFDVPVRLTADTEVEFHGDDLALSAIKVGDFVKVSGFFSNARITAKEVEVLDRGSGEFRLRGQIDAVRLASNGTIITVMGVSVLVDSNTKIERRGPDGGFSASNLAAGFLVDAAGVRRDGQFVATRVKVGNREDDAIRVEFAGRISRLESNRLVVDTEGGSTAVVLITSGTTVVGSPAVGRFAQIRGTLNERLEVVATRIRVKDHRDADDDDDDERVSLKFEKEIAIVPISSANPIHGSAEIGLEQQESRIEQELEVEIKRAQPLTEYRIRIEISGAGMVDFGTFRTNSEGEAEVKFKSDAREGRDLRALLPAGKSVRDFLRIQILNRDSVVLAQGSF